MKNTPVVQVYFHQFVSMLRHGFVEY